MQWRYALSLLFLGSVFCWNDGEDLQDLKNRIADIPELGSFNQSNVPSVEDIQDVIKKKCEKNGGEQAYQKLNESQEVLQTCLQQHFNMSVIQEEVEKSKKTGSMDEVFVKYCAKTNLVENCIDDFLKSVEPCLEEEEKKNLKLMFNITNQVAEFVCFKDGDRIAMFVAEGGVECLQSQKDEIQQCFNDTLNHRIPNDISINSIPLLMIGAEECEDYGKLQTCVVKKLEKCKDNTPANIVDALFRFIRRATPCKNHGSKDVPSTRRRYRAINEENYKKARDMYIQSMAPVCRINGGEKAFEDLENAMAAFEKVLKNETVVFDNNVKKQDPVQHLCGHGFKQMRNTTKYLVSRIKVCTNQPKSNLSAMAFDIFDSTQEYICKDEAKAFKILLSQGATCMDRLGNEASKCMSKVNHLNPKTLGANVTKTELCNELSTVKNCLVHLVGEKCGDTEFGKSTVNELAAAVYAPCSGSWKSLNVEILMLVLIFFTGKNLFDWI